MAHFRSFWPRGQLFNYNNFRAWEEACIHLAKMQTNKMELFLRSPINEPRKSWVLQAVLGVSDEHQSYCAGGCCHGDLKRCNRLATHASPLQDQRPNLSYINLHQRPLFLPLSPSISHPLTLEDQNAVVSQGTNAQTPLIEIGFAVFVYETQIVWRFLGHSCEANISVFLCCQFTCLVRNVAYPLTRCTIAL